MTAPEVFEIYIGDVVRLLPRRLRADVAAELRSLLAEQWQVQRATHDLAISESAAATEMVRSYGAPNEVAAQYQPPVSIIEPADTTSFVRMAWAGAAVCVVLGAFASRVPAPPTDPKNPIGLGILAWLGVLMLAFGLKGWWRRRNPKVNWVPRDPDRVNRIGVAIAAPICLACVAFYAVPVWALKQVSGNRLAHNWAEYTPEFQANRLPFLLALLTALVGVLVVAAIHGRWRRSTRRWDAALNVALAGLVMLIGIEGNIFQERIADDITRGVMMLVTMLYVPVVAGRMLAEVGRIDLPEPNRNSRPA